MGRTNSRKVKSFKSYEDYESWTDSLDNCSEYSEIPVVIDDGWKVAVDMFTECKSFKTAIRRFANTFAEVEAVKEWAEGMQESCESGYFGDTTGWQCSFSYDEEENKRLNRELAQKSGFYSWGVEEVDESRWYIFLNVAGIYAGRPERA